MRTMVSSLNELMLQMLKWRRKRGVTAFLPPPGGPMAEISCRSVRVIFEVSLRSYLQHKDSITEFYKLSSITAHKSKKTRTDNWFIVYKVFIYQFPWSKYWRSSSIGGCAPNTSFAGIFMSSTKMMHFFPMGGPYTPFRLLSSLDIIIF